MKTYHKVILTIKGLKHNTVKYAGIVYSEKLPEETFEETKTADIYTEYYESKAEAMWEIRMMRKYLN